MICSAAISFVLLMYDPRDGHLRGVEEFCSVTQCEAQKELIVQNAQPQYREFLQKNNRCLPR